MNDRSCGGKDLPGLSTIFRRYHTDISFLHGSAHVVPFVVSPGILAGSSDRKMPFLSVEIVFC